MNALQAAQKAARAANAAAGVAKRFGGAVGTAGEVVGAVAEIVAPWLVRPIRARRLRVIDRRKRQAVEARVDAGGPA